MPGRERREIEEVAAVRDHDRVVTPAVRFGFLVPLALGCGWVGVVLTFRTQAGWAVGSPLSAATIGACYLGGMAALAVAAEQRRWLDVRTPVLASLILLGLSVGVIWLHRNEFPIVWFAVHAVLLVAGLAVLVWQLNPSRAFAKQSPFETGRKERAQWWIAAPVASVALIGTLLGLAVLLAPQRIEPYWPWAASPLDLRMTGVWILALGAGSWFALAEGDPARWRAGAAGCVVAGLLALLALVTHPGEVRWDHLPSRIYAGLMLALAVEGTAAWIRATRRTR
ncbi:MAG TPA: hypothetical protein VF062_08200 [Candidatus Limnocylindrales bacterium]